MTTMVFHHFASMVGPVNEDSILRKSSNNDNLKTEKKFLSNLDKHINTNLDDETINPTEKIGLYIKKSDFFSLKEFIS